jgi:hypothetical protein
MNRALDEKKAAEAAKYGVEGARDAEDNENWFWDTLGDLHDE